MSEMRLMEIIVERTDQKAELGVGLTNERALEMFQAIANERELDIKGPYFGTSDDFSYYTNLDPDDPKTWLEVSVDIHRRYVAFYVTLSGTAKEFEEAKEVGRQITNALDAEGIKYRLDFRTGGFLAP